MYSVLLSSNKLSHLNHSYLVASFYRIAPGHGCLLAETPVQLIGAPLELAPKVAASLQRRRKKLYDVIRLHMVCAAAACKGERVGIDI